MVLVVTLQTQVSGHSGPVTSWALQGQEKQEVTLPQILWLPQEREQFSGAALGNLLYFRSFLPF